MAWGADTRTKKHKQKETWGAATKPSKRGRYDQDSRHLITDVEDGEIKYDWLGRRQR